MGKLNIIIDGTWLFRACCPDQVLSNQTIYPSSKFNIDFNKFNETLLKHLQNNGQHCNEIGDHFLATSIFKLPDNIDSWPEDNDDIDKKAIDRLKRNIAARRTFITNATRYGYSESTIIEPELKAYIFRRILNKSYSEKQVDTTVVALAVKSAITLPHDFHAIITGDADIIPAISVAYPEYSKNVFIVTTHPDELKAHYRQSSWSLTDFEFKIPPMYLQDYTENIIYGNHIYRCCNCNKIFVNNNPIPVKARPYCPKCLATRK